MGHNALLKALLRLILEAVPRPIPLQHSRGVSTFFTPDVCGLPEGISLSTGKVHTLLVHAGCEPRFGIYMPGWLESSSMVTILV
jgi:hypothetical protein